MTRELKVGAFLRYMDDFALFSDDLGRLTEAREAIGEWLREKRGLTLNRKRRRVLPAAQPSTFLGYRVSRAGVVPGRKLKRRMRKRLRALRGQEPGTVIRSLRSYRGWMTFG